MPEKLKSSLIIQNKRNIAGVIIARISPIYPFSSNFCIKSDDGVSQDESPKSLP